MGKSGSTGVQPVSVRVTVDGYGESFWVEPLPGQSNVGTVGNALGNGAIGYGDVVEWNSDGEVVAIVSRSDRATLTCWIEDDPEDLAIQAKWTQASKDAARVWGERGVVVEGGLGGLLIAAFVVQKGVDLTQQLVDLLQDLPDEDWQLRCQVGPHPGTPTDLEALGITLSFVDDDEDDDPDPSLLPDISERLLTDARERDLIGRLKTLGHIHAGLDDQALLSCALFLLTIDYRCYRSCLQGRNDQVLVLAGRTLSLRQGVLLAPLDGPVFETDFLEE